MHGQPSQAEILGILQNLSRAVMVSKCQVPYIFFFWTNTVGRCMQHGFRDRPTYDCRWIDRRQERTVDVSVFQVTTLVVLRHVDLWSAPAGSYRPLKLALPYRTYVQQVSSRGALIFFTLSFPPPISQLHFKYTYMSQIVIQKMLNPDLTNCYNFFFLLSLDLFQFLIVQLDACVYICIHYTRKCIPNLA